MKKKYIIPLLVILVLLVLPINMLLGTDERNYYMILGFLIWKKGLFNDSIAVHERALKE